MPEQDYKSRNGSYHELPSRFTTLRDWVAVGFRRRRLMMLSFFGVFLGAVLFAEFWAANYYTVSAKILVSQQRSDPTVSPMPENPASPVASTYLSDEQMNTEVSLLQSQDILRQVVLDCGLYLKPSIFDFLLPKDPEARKQIKVAKAVRSLAKALDMEVETKANVIDVTYGTRAGPATAARVVDDLVRLYLEKRLQLNRPPGSYDFFAQETEKYRKGLMATEARLASFGREQGAVAPDYERTVIQQKLAESLGTLRQTQAALAGGMQRVRNLEAQMASTSPRITTQEVTQGAYQLLEQLHENLVNAELKRTQLLMKYDPSYPLVQEADQEVAQIRAAIAEAEKTKYRDQTTDLDSTHEFLRQELAKAKADVATLKATETANAESVRAFREATLQLDRKALLQQDLIREAKASEQSYLMYLGKREEARSQDVLDSKRIANVAVAVPPMVPVLPHYSPLLVIMLGALLASCVSMGAAFVAEYLDPSFRTPDEVEELLNVPVFASIPSNGG